MENNTEDSPQLMVVCCCMQVHMYHENFRKISFISQEFLATLFELMIDIYCRHSRFPPSFLSGNIRISVIVHGYSSSHWVEISSRVATASEAGPADGLIKYLSPVCDATGP